MPCVNWRVCVFPLKLSLIGRGLIGFLHLEFRIMAAPSFTYTDPRILFGLRLAQLRRERGWSQETLAFESGVARSYLGGVERGKRNLSLVNICRLAATLELPPAMLLDFAPALALSRKRR